MTADTPQGWFIVHVDEAPRQGSAGHSYTALEGDERWKQYGFSIDVVDPGVGNSYHRELHDDESFLVLDGEFDLVIEGELHRVRAGAFVHCPAGTAHVFVGAGDRPSTIVMVGARGHTPPGGTWGDYLPDPHAARLGVAVDAMTSDPDIAYAGRPPHGPVETVPTWHLQRDGAATPSAGRADGWYILDVDEGAWLDNGRTMRLLLGSAQYGLNVHVLRPGEPNCRYHREHHFDETMLVLDGEAIALIEGEQRPVRAGDIIHCPAGTAHVFVGAGDAPCAILMLGTRDAELEASGAWGEYPADELAATYAASVDETTSDPDTAYADRPLFVPAEPIWTLRAAEPAARPTRPHGLR